MNRGEYMNFPSRIYLVGMMGTGKTTIGTQLSYELHYRFIDLDHLIVEKEGMSIATLFAEKGEPYFRRLEKEVLRQTSQLSNVVISTGGGIVLDQQNREFLEEEFCIYLKASIQELVRRLRNDQKRPLLQGEVLQNRIEKIISERENFYLEVASIEMDTTSKSVRSTIEELTLRLGGKL